MGCVPDSYTTLRLSTPLDARQPNHLRIEAHDQVFECDLPAGSAGCSGASGVTAYRSGEQWTHFGIRFGITERATITVTRSGAPTTQEVTPTSETDYPNGEDCPPACPHPVLTF